MLYYGHRLSVGVPIGLSCMHKASHLEEIITDYIDRYMKYKEENLCKDMGFVSSGGSGHLPIVKGLSGPPNALSHVAPLTTSPYSITAIFINSNPITIQWLHNDARLAEQNSVEMRFHLSLDS